MKTLKRLKMKRVLALAACTVLTCLASAQARADGYPAKQIRMIVPFTPGGSNDVLARIVSNKLNEMWKVPVVVENRTGAGGNIAAEFVARSTPDGYTLLVAANTMVTVNQHLYARLPFDPEKDLVPVAMLGSVPMVLTVNSAYATAKGIKTTQDLVAYSKSHPGTLAYGSSGAGVIHHLSAEMFKSMSGASMIHVPYRGTAPAVMDLISGQIQVMFAPANTIVPYIQSDKVKALAVSSAKRSKLLPDMPAVAEEGYPNYESLAYALLMAPAGTPPDVVEKIHVAVDHILGDPAVRKTLAEQYIETEPQPVSQLKTLLKDDTRRWGEVIKNAGIRLD